MPGLIQPQWSEKNGTVRIANEVVGIIAGLAATEVRGVAGMSGGVVDGISELLKKKSLSKGVRVEVGEKEAAVDLYVVIEYGARIPDVAINIQENVKRAIEGMTGLKVVEVMCISRGSSSSRKRLPLRKKKIG